MPALAFSILAATPRLPARVSPVRRCRRPGRMSATDGVGGGGGVDGSGGDDGGGGDADSDAPKLSQDWRSFRAKLVSGESAPAARAKGGGLDEHGFWAHRIEEPESGCVLVARPEEVDDGFFSKSVVLLLSHSQEGTFGLCLNKPVASSLASVPMDSSSPVGAAFQVAKAECFAENALLSGGPVNEASLIMLHGTNLASASHVMDGVYCGGLLGAIVAVRSGELPAERCRFFSGYSAWSGGQLDEEIARGAWLTAATSAKYILEYRLPPDGGDCMWRRILAELGEDAAA
jgi:putative AlgH/UPF0301 family transcriptional regulator